MSSTDFTDRNRRPEGVENNAKQRQVGEGLALSVADLSLTVGARLRAQAEARGDAAFVVCDDDRLTYLDAEALSAELARGLLQAGVGRGSRVGLLYPNRPEFVVGFLAAARIGAIAVPLSTFSTAKELADLVDRADVDLLLAAAAYRSHDYVLTLTNALPGLDTTAPGPLRSMYAPALRRVLFSDAPASVHPDWRIDALPTASREVLAAVEAEVTPADPLVIVHTSGSTSAPKGVVHAHGPLLRQQEVLNELRRYDASEVLFAGSPWFWIGGLAYALLGTLVAGARLVCSNAAEPSAVLDLLERERPTMVNGFAAGVAHLPNDPSFAARDLSSIRRGNLYPIMPDDVRPADPGLRHGMLGMTEAGSVCVASDDESDQPEHRRGSFGRPVTGFESRIVDTETGALCSTGQPGILELRGPFLLEGYYGRERVEAVDADGWFRTGDLFHADADGFLYFGGRAGDMIKTGGANVSPREVEAVIADEAGLRSHVIGLDDDVKGQIVAVAIVADDPVDLDQLKATLREHLSAYKVPKVIVQLAADEVPMMSSGKLDPRALKERLRAG